MCVARACERVCVCVSVCVCVCVCCSDYLTAQTQTVVSAVVFATGLWLVLIMLLRYTLKALLSHHGWIFECHGRKSFSTRVWLVH